MVSTYFYNVSPFGYSPQAALSDPWSGEEAPPPPPQPDRALPSWANQPSPLQFSTSAFKVCKSEKPYIGLDLKKQYRSLDLVLQAKQNNPRSRHIKPNTF